MLVKTRLQINAVISVMTAIAIVLAILLVMGPVTRAMEELKIASEIMTCAYERDTVRNDHLRTNGVREKNQWFAKDDQLGRLLRSASEKIKTVKDQKIIDEVNRGHLKNREIFTAMVESREMARSTPDSTALSQEAESRLLNQMRMGVYETAINARRLDEWADRRPFSALRLAPLLLEE